jgi:BirA family biotin operon repressor/biotin-[acetyl-CoA-carboxylase] ligase
MIATTTGELGKLGGILVQLQNNHVVVGIGINTGLDVSELPTQLATSLAIAGLDIPREVLIAQILVELEVTTGDTTENWHNQYVSISSTLGNRVQVTNLNQETLSGLAKSISNAGALILETDQGLVEVIAGDLMKVRT